MAPEFFPLIGFVLLFGATVVFAIFVALLYKRRPRDGREIDYGTRLLRRVVLTVFVGLLAMLLLLGFTLYKVHLLDEPVASAAASGDLAEVQRLLDRGASVDAYCIDYQFPALVGAAARGHVEVVELLLRRGANPSLRNSDGRSALRLARENGHKEVLELLETYGGEE